MFRDVHSVIIKVIPGKGTRVTLCEDPPGGYEAWVRTDSEKHLIDGMSFCLGFSVLDTDIFSDFLIGSYEDLLSRMPASIRDMRGPAYVSQMNTRQQARDIHTLFLPLLLEVFLRWQKKNLKKTVHKDPELREYFAGSHKYLKLLLHKDSRARMLSGRLKVSKHATISPLVLDEEGLASVRNPKRRFLIKRDNRIHATQKAWQAWVRAVINDPTIIIGDDTGNKNPDKTKNKTKGKKRGPGRKDSRNRCDKGACKSSNPSDGVKTTRHVATSITQDGPAYEVIDLAAEIWGDPNDDAELGNRLDEIDTIVNTHDKDLYARFIDNQDGSLWMP